MPYIENPQFDFGQRARDPRVPDAWGRELISSWAFCAGGISLLVFLCCCPWHSGHYTFSRFRPTYTGSATMIIETRKGSSALPDTFGGMPPDSAWIETQIGVLKSLNVLAYVVKQLRLADDPQFIRGDTWPLEGA